MDIEKVKLNSQDSIRKIISFIYQEDTSEATRVQVEDIFLTKPGKLFAQQVDQIVNFAIRGLSLSVIPATYPYIKEIIPQLLVNIISDLLKKLCGNQIDTDILLKEVKGMMASRLDQKDLTEGFQSFPSVEDRSYYFSFTILALYAYLDVYFTNLLELIHKNKNLGEILSDYLIDQLRIKPTVAHNIVRLKKKLWRIIEKLQSIESAFSISEVLSSFETQKNVEIFREGLWRFFKIRNDIAHSNPKLNHEEYSYEDLESDLNNFKISFEYVEQFAERIRLTRYGQDATKAEASDIARVLEKVHLALIMVIIYPAIIDVVIHEYLS